MEDKLTRDTNNRIIGGVAAGLSKRFGMEVSIKSLGEKVEIINELFGDCIERAVEKSIVK